MATFGPRWIEARSQPSGATRPARGCQGTSWAILLARLFATFPLICPQRGAEMRLIAVIAAAESVRRILSHLGDPAEPPRIAPARGAARKS